MGHRCNMVIIENGDHTLYYSHWGAISLDDILFWGPDIARWGIEGYTKTEDWLDEIWSEGGCVVDYDKKHLLWYGGEDTAYEPDINQICLELMAHQWPQWTIDWATDGIFDIAKKTGINQSEVHSGEPIEICNLSEAKPYKSGEDNFFYFDGMISIGENGVTRWAIVSGYNVASLAGENVDPKILKRLVDEFSVLEFEKQYQLDSGSSIEWGVHLDLDVGTLEYWHTKAIEGVNSAILNNWAPVSVISHGPDFAWHTQLVNCALMPSVTVKKKLAYVEQLKASHKRHRPNPQMMADIAHKLASESDQEVRFNPHFFEKPREAGHLVPIKLEMLERLSRIVRTSRLSK